MRRPREMYMVAHLRFLRVTAKIEALEKMILKTIPANKRAAWLNALSKETERYFDEMKAETEPYVARWLESQKQ